jgi:hypothetical protein
MAASRPLNAWRSDGGSVLSRLLQLAQYLPDDFAQLGFCAQLQSLRLRE